MPYQLMLVKDEGCRDLRPLTAHRKTYQDEIKEMMDIKSYARENPFADPEEWRSEDFELLRDRAKIHMSKWEWDRALFNLNRTLYDWGANIPEEYDYSDPPNKQSLLLRCKIRLLLCENENALADALAILTDLKTSDPLYCKGLTMHGDALFQMGRFEHALVIYHRGIKLRNRGDTNEEFKVRIQKTINSINNSLKNIQKKMKVDINVEDTTERRLVSRQSFVFPRNSLESKQVTRTFFRTRKLGIDTSTLAIKTPKPSIAPNGKISTGYKNPYAKDIISMKNIVSTLDMEGNTLSDLSKFADETLDYLKTREKLWKKQAERSGNRIIDFSPDNLAQFYEEDKITLRKNKTEEDTEEKDC